MWRVRDILFFLCPTQISIKRGSSYPRIFDEFFAVVFVAGSRGPLPVDLDAVDDALPVEVVDGGRQVGEARRAAHEEAAEHDVLAPEAGHEARRRVLLAEVGEVGEGA